MGQAAPISVTFRFAEREDLAAIGEFLRDLGDSYFNEKRFPGKSARDFYEWKYFGNPMGDAVVGVAMAGSRVVSMLAAMVKPLQVEGRRVTAYEIGDFLTVPDFRKRGLGSRLTEMLYAEMRTRGAALVYGQPNDVSFPVLMKLGFEEPQQIHQRSYAVPSRAISRRLHVSPKLISWTHIDDLTRSVAAPAGSRSVRVERISRFDAESDRIWEKARDGYKFLVVRESEFLNWRYVDSPTPYQIWLARRGNEPVGFLVGFSGKDERVGEIVDLFTSESDLTAARALLHHAFKEFHSQGMRAILAYTIVNSPRSMVGKLLRRACPIARQRPLHFILRSFESSVTPPLPTSGWHLAPGDFDGV